jgi:type I restriction enzyme S subunit
MGETTTWGEISTLVYGKALKNYDQDSSRPVRVFGTNGAIGYTDVAQHAGPHVIIGRKGAYRGVHLATTPFWVIDTAYYLDLSAGVDARWAYYALQNTDIDTVGSGSAVPSTTREDFYALPLRLPKHGEQRAIAEVLGALDDKIAANEHAAVLAVSLIDALHRRALSAGPTSSLSLFDVFDVDFGEPFKGGEFCEPGTGRPLIRIRDLTTHEPQIWTMERRPGETVIQAGDVVVGMDAEFRASWWLGEPGLLNQRVCRVRGTSTGSAFAAESLRKPLGAIENEKAGTTVIHLNKSDLTRTKIDMPAPGALAEFEAKAEPLVQSRVATALENRQLAHTRDELLPLLMSGKLRVRDAEKVAEEVT